MTELVPVWSCTRRLSALPVPIHPRSAQYLRAPQNQFPMCSLQTLTYLQVQVLPRQWMVGPSSDSRPWPGEPLVGASSAVNGRACRRRRAVGGDWPAALVPERPGRREPRAVKRKKNKYSRLDAPRHKFRDHPKRNVRHAKARLRKLGLYVRAIHPKGWQGVADGSSGKWHRAACMSSSEHAAVQRVAQFRRGIHGKEATPTEKRVWGSWARAWVPETGC